jgi:hypothetical protein
MSKQGSTIASRALHPYASEAYASAFNLDRVWLPNTRTYVLLRPIPNSDRRDAMGCYPLCVLEGLKGIDEDLALLAAQGVVSLVLVTDCLSQPPEEELSKHFDVCRPYKTHYVYDARLPNADYSKHHRHKIRRALKSCETRVVDLGEHLDSWMASYNTLIAKKGITGIQAFSADYFAKLATIPGFVTIGAFVDGAFVSGHIWVRHERVAYAHLAASNPQGYTLRCAFPIYDQGIRLLRDECVIDFGGGAGVESEGKDSLSEFKRGFANVEYRNFLCGKILDAGAYRGLCSERGILDSGNYFPAYRAPVPSPAPMMEESL